MKEKLECIWMINVGLLFGLKNWDYIGGHPLKWWKSRYIILKEQRK